MFAHEYATSTMSLASYKLAMDQQCASPIFQQISEEIYTYVHDHKEGLLAHAYQVMTDDATHNMVVRRIFGMQAESTAETKDHAALDAAKVSAARMEAGAKLAENHEAVVADIMKNSGLGVCF